MIYCANYEDQRIALLRFLKGESRSKILFLKGSSGYGKTNLINYCLCELPSFAIPHVPFTFKKGNDITVEEILSRVSSIISRPMPIYESKMNDLTTVNIYQDHNVQIGNQNLIQQVVFHAITPEQQNLNRQLLTNAWFDDLCNYNSPILIIFDNWDKAVEEVRSWVTATFLSRAVHVPCMKVIITGSEIPDVNDLEWRGKSEFYELPGVFDEKNWEPVLKAMGRKAPKEMETVSWLDGLCIGARGNPNAIMQILVTLPFTKDE